MDNAICTMKPRDLDDGDKEQHPYKTTLGKEEVRMRTSSNVEKFLSQKQGHFRYKQDFFRRVFTSASNPMQSNSIHPRGRTLFLIRNSSKHMAKLVINLSSQCKLGNKWQIHFSICNVYYCLLGDLVR